MPEKTLVELLHEESNFVVLKMPGRKYPAVLIQGDSLAGLVGDLSEAIKYFESDREEALGCLNSVHEDLKSRLDQYFDVCQAHGIS